MTLNFDMLYPWQANVWQQLQNLRQRLPHGLLFYGPQGIGKDRLARIFAQSLLCESLAGHRLPCGFCSSCKWFLQNQHPDCRIVQPDAMEDQSTELSREISQDERKLTKAPSKEIRIDQIRELTNFVNLSSHRLGMRVIVLSPAERLNTAAASALLKTLEEPNQNIVFILLTENIDKVLPTVVSRCRKFALTPPTTDIALQWLQTQGVSKPQTWLAEFSGAPLAALEASQSPSEDHEAFLEALENPRTDIMLKAAERLQKTNLKILITKMQRWTYDLLSYALTQKIRYFPERKEQIQKLLPHTTINNLLRMQRSLNQCNRYVMHPLSPRLVLEDMLLCYQALFFGIS